MSASRSKKSLLERLRDGPVVCAEGYLFEFERRGYLQAGAYVPEVVLEHPELVAQLHREFVRAGSDVVEAFTYYAHREKLRLIGREEDLERINRQALKIAKEVAAEHDSLFAGNICNTNIYDPTDPSSHEVARAMFAEQVGWAVDADVDFIIGETFSFAAEALIALDVIKRANKPAVITLAMHRADVTREQWKVADACKRIEPVQQRELRLLLFAEHSGPRPRERERVLRVDSKLHAAVLGTQVVCSMAPLSAAAVGDRPTHHDKLR